MTHIKRSSHDADARRTRPRPTPAALLAAARALFAVHGYRGASVREIAAGAGANLGAIAYHFGSKRGLFEAVADRVASGAREAVVAAAGAPGSALDRVEAVVRAFFAYLYENADVPQLIMHVVAAGDSLPDAARATMGGNLRTLAGLISEGQADGSIRSGDPELMALSVASQPLWLVLASRVLREGAAVDQDDPATRGELVQSVVRFVRAGLQAAAPSGPSTEPECLP